MNQFQLFDEIPLAATHPAQLEALLKSRDISYESKIMGKSLHIRAQSHGFEVEYEMGGSCPQLHSLFLYVNNAKNKPYPSCYSLPYRLPHRLTILGAVMLLGEPTRKSKYMTECMWGQLGIDGLFCGGGWQDEGLQLDYLCLYPAESGRLCSVCHANMGTASTVGCQQCRVVAYCGEKCKQKHYRLHQMYCQSIDDTPSNDSVVRDKQK